MYDIVMRYLARAFARFQQPELNLQTYADIGNAVRESDWLPRQVAEVLPTGVTAQRVSLASRTGDWSINVLGDSVDVQYTSVLNAPTLPFGDFCLQASERLSTTLEVLKIRAHRIASLQEGVLPLIPELKLETCFRKLLNVPSVLDGVPSFEWDWRIGIEKKRQFDGMEALTNTIAIVKRVGFIRVDGRQSERLFVSTDINTSPKSAESLFGPAEVRAFVAGSAEWHRDLSANLIEYVGLE